MESVFCFLSSIKTLPCSFQHSNCWRSVVKYFTAISVKRNEIFHCVCRIAMIITERSVELIHESKVTLLETVAGAILYSSVQIYLSTVVFKLSPRTLQHETLTIGPATAAAQFGFVSKSIIVLSGSPRGTSSKSSYVPPPVLLHCRSQCFLIIDPCTLHQSCRAQPNTGQNLTSSGWMVDTED